MAESRAFDLLDETVRRWVWEQHWSGLRDVQERAIPAILEEKHDVILAAATASGKTEAAFLPIVTKVGYESDDALTVLYIAPLKALINDQFSRLDLLTERMEIPVTRWHGDSEASRKKSLLKKPRGFLLITPESLEAILLRQGSAIAHLFAGLRYIVVDELHAFMGSERGRQLQTLLHRIEAVVNRRIPRIGLSATIADMRDAASFLRPQDSRETILIRSSSESVEIKAQIKGFIVRVPIRNESQDTPDDETDDEDADDRERVWSDRTATANYLFRTLRGGHHLIFCQCANGSGGIYRSVRPHRRAGERPESLFSASRQSVAGDSRGHGASPEGSGASGGRGVHLYAGDGD